MKPEILENFFDQSVRVGIGGRNFSGIMRQSELDDTVIEIEPDSDYDKKHYGTFILKIDEIIYIQSIKPYVDEKNDDESAEDAGE